jgi:predicted DNA binding CopG/RHH family protein
VGLLASLTSPGQLSGQNPPDQGSSNLDPANEELSWPSSELGEGVASLTYEQALRTHARYRPSGRDNLPPPQTAGTAASPAAFTKPAFPTVAEPPHIEDRPAKAGDAPSASAARDVRSASVTIRLSQPECARLHRRAAEAGLTVSAYLRSCVLEAESLRTQVKNALAEIKARTKEPSHPSGGKALAARLGGEQGNEQSRPANDAVTLNRVFGHIGKLWLGLSSGNRA